MITGNIEKFSSPTRTFTGKVEFYKGSTKATYYHDDELISVDVERIGDNKFFGFGICQKATIKLLDKSREIVVEEGDRFKVYLDDIDLFPSFYAKDIKRDENTNALTIIAYDAIGKATEHTVSEMVKENSYSIGEFITYANAVIGIAYTDLFGIENSGTMYPDGANFEGTETIRQALDAAAEATQTVYFLSKDEVMVFKRLDKDLQPVLSVYKDDYFTLDSKGDKRLGMIVATTELGDNYMPTVSGEQSGEVVFLTDTAIDTNNPMKIVGDFPDDEVKDLEVFGKNLLVFKKNYVSKDSGYTRLTIQNGVLQLEVTVEAIMLSGICATTRFIDTYTGLSHYPPGTYTYSGNATVSNGKTYSGMLRTILDDGTTFDMITGTTTFTQGFTIEGVRLTPLTATTSPSFKMGDIITISPILTYGTTTGAFEPGRCEVHQLDKNGAYINFAPPSMAFATTELDYLTITYQKMLDTSGETQYIRDNPFWELREDQAALVDAALPNVCGLTINQFNCKWRGNYLTEIGDKIEFQTKDDSWITGYILNDVIKYNGGLSQETKWEYKSGEATAANPTSLGEVLKQTYAKVDKQNKQIDMLVSETGSTKEQLASLQITTDGINATVSSINTSTREALDGINNDISTLTNKVSVAMTSEDVKIEIQNELANGTSRVETATGFTFDDTGLSITKSGSDISTTITEDGMSVYNQGNEVLTANNKGVKAVDLHATTYLIVGTNSRFENYGSDRTGCFWIGG